MSNQSIIEEIARIDAELAASKALLVELTSRHGDALNTGGFDSPVAASLASAIGGVDSRSQQLVLLRAELLNEMAAACSNGGDI